MKLERQVCNKDLSKRLRELKVKQKSLWYWAIIERRKANKWKTAQAELQRKKYKDINELDGGKRRDRYYSAFTVAELGEMLPGYIELKDGSCYMLRVSKGHSVINGKEKYSFSVFYIQLRNMYISVEDKKEADARAIMLIYLIENKLMGVKK